MSIENLLTIGCFNRCISRFPSPSDTRRRVRGGTLLDPDAAVVADEASAKGSAAGDTVEAATGNVTSRREVGMGARTTPGPAHPLERLQSFYGGGDYPDRDG